MAPLDAHKSIEHLCNIYQLTSTTVRLNRYETTVVQDIVCEIDDILNKSESFEDDVKNADLVNLVSSDEEMDVDIDVKPSIEPLQPTGSFINAAADAIPLIKIDDEDIKFELEKLIEHNKKDYLYICVYCKHRSETGHIDEVKFHLNHCPVKVGKGNELIRIPNIDTFLSLPLFDMKKAIKSINIKREDKKLFKDLNKVNVKDEKPTNLI